MAIHSGWRWGYTVWVKRRDQRRFFGGYKGLNTEQAPRHYIALLVFPYREVL